MAKKWNGPLGQSAQNSYHPRVRTFVWPSPRLRLHRLTEFSISSKDDVPRRQPLAKRIPLPSRLSTRERATSRVGYLPDCFAIETSTKSTFESCWSIRLVALFGTSPSIFKIPFSHDEDDDVFSRFHSNRQILRAPDGDASRHRGSTTLHWQY